ncbi:unnamed protein product [Pleuronectes platessa]|uniref:Uncharacterized protein n=1 Tax=Pleuronectes platessa TaxID=8262 RepID=A0A9N7YB44_PLEPL|nr:unnamed protein product [Pleuronectes platessa]
MCLFANETKRHADESEQDSVSHQPRHQPPTHNQKVLDQQELQVPGPHEAVCRRLRRWFHPDSTRLSRRVPDTVIQASELHAADWCEVSELTGFRLFCGCDTDMWQKPDDQLTVPVPPPSPWRPDHLVPTVIT